jgi:hypothetical protein
MIPPKIERQWRLALFACWEKSFQAATPDQPRLSHAYL